MLHEQPDGSGEDEDILTISVDDRHVVISGATHGSIPPYTNQVRGLKLSMCIPRRHEVIVFHGLMFMPTFGML